MNTTRWIIPEAPEPRAQATAAAMQQERGAAVFRLGLLDNTKDNAKKLLELIAAQVRAEMPIEVILRTKDNAATGATPELLDELAREADCVLTAMAD